MDARTFDAFTRSAAAVPRRRSFLLLGGAGLAATLGRPPVAVADKKSKKKCKQEKQQCRQFIQVFCEEEAQDEQQCLEDLLPCCATCKVKAGLACILALL